MLLLMQLKRKQTIILTKKYITPNHFTVMFTNDYIAKTRLTKTLITNGNYTAQCNEKLIVFNGAFSFTNPFVRRAYLSHYDSQDLKQAAHTNRKLANIYLPKTIASLTELKFTKEGHVFVLGYTQSH